MTARTLDERLASTSDSDAAWNLVGGYWNLPLYREYVSVREMLSDLDVVDRAVFWLLVQHSEGMR